MSPAKKLHPPLKPLKWLLGEWLSVEAERCDSKLVMHPICSSFIVKNEGLRALTYTFNMWDAEGKRARQSGRGFIKMKEKSDQVALLNSHTFGIVSLEDGCSSSECLLVVASKIFNLSFARQPPLKHLQRMIKLEKDILHMQICIACEKHPTLHEYFKGTFKKKGSC